MGKIRVLLITTCIVILGPVTYTHSNSTW